MSEMFSLSRNYLTTQGEIEITQGYNTGRLGVNVYTSKSNYIKQYRCAGVTGVSYVFSTVEDNQISFTPALVLYKVLPGPQPVNFHQ